MNADQPLRDRSFTPGAGRCCRRPARSPKTARRAGGARGQLSPVPRTAGGTDSERSAKIRDIGQYEVGSLAYELLHTARTALEAERKEGISLRRLRRLVLLTGTRVVRHSRLLTLVIERRFADVWGQVCPRLHRWCCAPP